MLNAPPEVVYTLTNAGRSLKSWIGFRPSITGITKGKISKLDENAFETLRIFIRKTSTTTTKSVTGFNKRGRCCQELIPSIDFKLTKTDIIEIKGSKTFNVPETIDALFEDDIRRCLKNTYRTFLRKLSNKKNSRNQYDPKNKIVRSKPSIRDKMLENIKKLEITNETKYEDIAKRIDDKELLELFTDIYKNNIKIAASDNAELSSRMETAREDRKQMQVSYVESMDQESKSAYFAQREIGIKLDEVMEYEIQNQEDAKISKDLENNVDDSHEYGDFSLFTVEDDGNS
jgi:hypothetical protein